MTMMASRADVAGPGGPAAVVDRQARAAAAVLFRGFGDPSRLAILSHLMLGEHKVRELTEHLGLAQSTVSEHLRCLLGCGLVRVRAEGRASVYSLAAEPQVRELLMAAEGLLAATGAAVLLCPRAGDGAPAVTAASGAGASVGGRRPVHRSVASPLPAGGQP